MKFVLVHGAGHRGEHFEEVAGYLRAEGHDVVCPTLKGSNPGDDRKTTTLADAIDSLVDILSADDMQDVVLMGHSWGGMAITGAFDKLPAGKVKRLIYHSAFVPNPGESLMDMVAPDFAALLKSTSEESGEVIFPEAVLRETFMNDADIETVIAHAQTLSPQAYRTMADPIELSQPPAAFECGKSYLLSTEDTALPHSLPWHPRLSEKLGLFRLVAMPGGHSVFKTAPKLLAQKLIEAGRD